MADPREEIMETLGALRLDNNLHETNHWAMDILLDVAYEAVVQGHLPNALAENCGVCRSLATLNHAVRQR